MSRMIRPRVCKNMIVLANYSDQLEDRLEVERDPYKELYDNYNMMLDENEQLKAEIAEHKKLASRMIQDDHYAMIDIDPDFGSKPSMGKQTPIHPSRSVSNANFLGRKKGSISEGLGTSIVKENKMQDQIEELKEKNTSLLQLKTELYEKLSKEQDKNMKLEKEFKALKEQFEKLKTDQSQNTPDPQQMDGLMKEIKARDQMNEKLTDENKQLKKDCKLMQERIIEEKSKVMEMMDEVHNVFDNVVHRNKGANTQVVNNSSMQSSMMMTQPDSGIGQSEHLGSLGPNFVDFSIKGANGLNIHLQDYVDPETPMSIPNEVKQKMIAHEGECTAIAYNPLGDTLATAGKDNLIKLWNVKDLNDVKHLNIGNTNCCAMAYSPDSELLMACTTNNKAALYAVRNGYKYTVQMKGHSDSITSTKFMLSNKQVVTSSMDSHIKFWDINSGSKSREINCKSKCYDMHVFRQERNLASGHKDCIKIWGTEKKALFDLEKPHSQPVSCVRVTQDENYIVSTSADSTLKLWDLRQRKLMQTFESEKYKIGSNNVKLCLSPNGQYAICGTKEGHVFYYDIKKGEVEDIQLKKHKSQVVACEWQPRSQNESQMASIDTFGGLLIWTV